MIGNENPNFAHHPKDYKDSREREVSMTIFHELKVADFSGLCVASIIATQ